MKKFISQLFFFACLLFCGALALQLLISNRIKGKIISENNNLEQTTNANAELVFLGSSRCAMHFDPNYFSTTFKLKSVNLGVNGHSEITMAITRLKYYLATNKPPRFAILNFDPMMLANNEADNFSLKDEFAKEAFFPKNKDTLFVNYFKFNFAEKYVPLYSLFKYRQIRTCVFFRNTNDFKKFGYRKNDVSWDGIINQKALAIRAKYFKKDQIQPITNSLLALKKLCVENNIKLMCIQTPVYKPIYEPVRFAWTQKICQNAKIPFVDTNSSSIINNCAYFLNINHLNKNGVSQMNQFLKNNTVLTSFLK